ncbi:hypothetical protein P3X46_000328 [Hevea brasiliensis]|uniref:PGG domain-containing protein n=1 Tax=Hevea brasiliensis TaxID=3981 RepID=A0ABQ9N9P9_HEVBR|nr:hypothetical protein P3X46_000328 [Hevea brasiliensis]
MASLQCVHPSSYIFTPYQQQNFMKFIFCFCFIVATVLSLDGNRILSIIIFKKLPSIIFHAFAVCLVLAFSGSFIALMIENETKIVRQICWYISVVSIAMVGSILAYSMSAPFYNWVSQVMQEGE